MNVTLIMEIKNNNNKKKNNYKLKKKKKRSRIDTKNNYRGEATNAKVLGRRRNFDDFIRVVVVSVSLFLSAKYLDLGYFSLLFKIYKI